ncbi:unnamed protein product [Lactuca saligna]|uniref:Uncharacterized protein n=1 Tax=Lactuca saligna TaxID=75948 RepID=A0AA35VG30_LACSI|nr:unnamed protein product [Lactuca saligna]
MSFLENFDSTISLALVASYILHSIIPLRNRFGQLHMGSLVISAEDGDQPQGKDGRSDATGSLCSDDRLRAEAQVYVLPFNVCRALLYLFYLLSSEFSFDFQQANSHNLAQENGVNDFLPLGNLEKVVKEIADQPLPLVDGIEDQLVEFSIAMRSPTFAKNLGNFEQKVGGSGSMKHYPIELENSEKSQRCCGENGICSHVLLMCIVSSKVARNVIKVDNKFF